MAGIDQNKIRNFCIIAHIDHGKSTLADRIIEHTGLLTSREMQSQVLDNMDLERERGITIKAQAVRTVYKAKDGEEYIFNLIDTPGHVDFTVEVSRSLRVLDGAVTVLDGQAGVEPQTETVWRQASEYNVPRIVFVNKMDKTVAVVTRYFGGIKLGTGGLTRAYGGSVSACLQTAKIADMQSATVYHIDIEYELYSKFQKFIEKPFVSVVATDFLNSVQVQIAIKSDFCKEFIEKLTDNFNGRLLAEVIDAGYYDFG